MRPWQTWSHVKLTPNNVWCRKQRRQSNLSDIATHAAGRRGDADKRVWLILRSPLVRGGEREMRRTVWRTATGVKEGERQTNGEWEGEGDRAVVRALRISGAVGTCWPVDVTRPRERGSASRVGVEGGQENLRYGAGVALSAAAFAFLFLYCLLNALCACGAAPRGGGTRRRVSQETRPAESPGRSPTPFSAFFWPPGDHTKRRRNQREGGCYSVL